MTNGIYRARSTRSSRNGWLQSHFHGSEVSRYAASLIDSSNVHTPHEALTVVKNQIGQHPDVSAQHRLFLCAIYS